MGLFSDKKVFDDASDHTVSSKNTFVLKNKHGQPTSELPVTTLKKVASNDSESNSGGDSTGGTPEGWTPLKVWPPPPEVWPSPGMSVKDAIVERLMKAGVGSKMKTKRPFSTITLVFNNIKYEQRVLQCTG
ncbi:hypothetical protein ElyMa_004237500 [Elysia marginata]|uniref:Uncharacterized protein n=1 Tax=Elysia marginata TaxID=1093978 RepID=A0AAV4GSA6_9GAST|nr:hypothetical protein ElyMa_004237500 [Elysia marginata]